MIDILHNIGKGVGAVVSGLALLFAGASNLPTQPPRQPASVAIAEIPMPKSAPAVATSTTRESLTALVGKSAPAPATIVAPTISPAAMAGVSKSYVDEQIQGLRNAISSDVFKNSSSFYPSVPGVSQATINNAISQHIDQLTNVTASNLTVHGVSGLAAADIPTNITANNYLPLTGGMLSGDLVLSGSLTVSGAQTLSSALTLPYFVATSTTASVLPYASSTAITVAGTASTSNLVVSNSFSLGALSGFLKATAGVVATSLVNLGSDVTGFLSVPNGGTGWANVHAGSILFGNGASALATSSSLLWDNANDRFGIGTTSPWAVLSVNPNGVSGPSFAIGSSTATNFIVTNGGNVGIGTTSPSQLLSVAGASLFAGTLSLDIGGHSWAFNNIGNGELGLTTNSPNNVLTLRNTNANAYAAMAAQDKDGYEQMAMGYSQRNGSGNIYPGSVYLETSGFAPDQLAGPANGFVLVQTGTYGGTRTNWTRLELTSDTNADLNLWAVTSDSGVLKKKFTLTGNSGEIGIGDRVGDSRAVFAGSGYALTLIDNNGKGLRTVKAGVRKLDQWIDSSGSPFWYRFQDTDAGGSVYPLSLALNGTGNATVSGSLGIGTTSPDMLLSVGSATPVGNVAHFENSTGSCYINPTTTSLSCSSDGRLKNNVNLLTASSGLASLMQLNPVTYNWNSEATGTPAHGGFIAQQVLPILPDLVSQGPDGYYTLNYAGFTPYLVKAVQEIGSVGGTFRDAMIAWMGNASNGIGDLYATAIHASTAHFSNELCVGSTCITPAQFQEMVAAINQSPTGNSPTRDTTPPVITITGDNPAHLHVGDTYIDLGATVTDNVDANLGVHAFVGTTPIEQAFIDTSAPATYHINYVATDSAGNTATSTRTVIVGDE